jgi:D-alanine-D-alanine ligase
MDRFLSAYKDYDLAIPVFHWEYWEDGMIFWLLDSIWMKYTFSPFATHAVCMDKNKSNILVEKIWVKVPKSYLFNYLNEISGIKFSYPLIVKPNSWWSSVATYKVNNDAELSKAVSDVIEITHDLVLVQEFISWTEYSVPVIWNDDLECLPIMRVELKTWEFFDYEEKYNSDGSNEIFWDVEENLKTSLEDDSKKIYKFLGCRWISRIDYIVNDSWIYFLEVNTIPGFSAASIFPKAWKLTWRSLKEIVEKIIILWLENKR